MNLVREEGGHVGFGFPKNVCIVDAATQYEEIGFTSQIM